MNTRWFPRVAGWSVAGMVAAVVCVCIVPLEVASTATDSGRQKNRRVEVVQK